MYSVNLNLILIQFKKKYNINIVFYTDKIRKSYKINFITMKYNLI